MKSTYPGGRFFNEVGGLCLALALVHLFQGDYVGVGLGIAVDIHIQVGVRVGHDRGPASHRPCLGDDHLLSLCWCLISAEDSIMKYVLGLREVLTMAPSSQSCKLS